MLERWLSEASAELGVDAPDDTEALLDVARVVAHRVERRAAPLTTYLVGAAVAGGGVSDAREAARRLVALARAWEHQEGSDRPSTTHVADQR